MWCRWVGVESTPPGGWRHRRAWGGGGGSSRDGEVEFNPHAGGKRSGRQSQDTERELEVLPPGQASHVALLVGSSRRQS